MVLTYGTMAIPQEGTIGAITPVLISTVHLHKMRRHPMALVILLILSMRTPETTTR